MTVYFLNLLITVKDIVSEGKMVCFQCVHSSKLFTLFPEIKYNCCQKKQCFQSAIKAESFYTTMKPPQYCMLTLGLC